MDVEVVRGLLAGGHPELTEVEPVVGREDDVGVVELTGGAQRAEQLADAVVDRLQRLDATPIQLVDLPLHLVRHGRQVPNELRLPREIGRVVRGVRGALAGKRPTSRGAGVAG